MTDHEGLFPDIQKILKWASGEDKIDMCSERIDEVAVRLDALMEAVPKGLGEPAGFLDMLVMTGEAAQLLYQATTERDDD